MKLLIMLLCVAIANLVKAQDKMEQETITEYDGSEKMYLVHASYESYAPKERDSYTLTGVNVGFQWNTSFEDTQMMMIMGPNISALNEKKSDVEEDIILVKWDHGLAYNIEFANNMQLKPHIVAGLGYGWLNSDRPDGQSQSDESAPLLELIGGIDFNPSESFNLFAKGGYRYFQVDDIDNKKTGQLEGQFAMLGLGVNY